MTTATTDQLTAANNSRDMLLAAIGPSLGYHVSQCPGGGYIVLVDGKVSAARSTLVEAMAAMASVAASKFDETAVPPERATDVTPPREPPGLPRELPRGIRPSHNGAANEAATGKWAGNETTIVERANFSAALVLAFIAVGVRGLVGL